MAAGLHGPKVSEDLPVADIYAWVMRLSKEDATLVHERAGGLIAYVRGLPDGEAAILRQVVEHAAEVRMSV